MLVGFYIKYLIRTAQGRTFSYFSRTLFIDSPRSIKLKSIGDFNTDFLNPYDVKCKENSFYEKFTDCHPSALDRIGTCLLEANCRDEKVSTPAQLRQMLLDCNEKVKFDFTLSYFSGPNFKL